MGEETTQPNSLPLSLTLICFFSLDFPIKCIFLQAFQVPGLNMLLVDLRGLTLVFVLQRWHAPSAPLSGSTPPLPPGEFCVFPARRDFHCCICKILCIDFSWGWELVCFILDFLSDTETLLCLCRQQEDWKDWDIRSTRQRTKAFLF